MAGNEKEITLLKEQVSHLMTLINSHLAADLTAPPLSVHQDPVSPATTTHASHLPYHSTVTNQPSHTTRTPRAPLSNSTENRKFNLVLSGIPEAPTGQSRSTRAIAVHQRVCQVLSDVLGDSNHLPLHVRDCRRLGKFQGSSRENRLRRHSRFSYCC